MSRRLSTTQVGLFLLAPLLLLLPWPTAWLPHDPLAQDLLRRLEAPSSTYWLGTDVLGRCVLSRVLAAARLSLGAALAASAVLLALALLWGVTAAWCAQSARWRLVDALLMRSADVLLGFPTLVLALAIIGVFGPSLLTVLLALIVAWTPGLARIVRILALQALQRDYVAAAHAAGLSQLRIVWRHVLPQLLAPLAALASLETAGVILALSTLSFLGLGAQPPTPEWGVMLNEARAFFQTAPHLLWAPGLAVLWAALAFNLVGEGLRERLEPRRPLRW